MSETKCAVYNAVTGAIFQVVECPAGDIALQAGEGQETLELGEGASINDESHYIALQGGRPQVRERASLDSTYVVEGLRVIFNALPPGLTVVVEDQFLVTDGIEDSVEFEKPGTYRLALRGLSAFQSQKLEVVINGAA